MENSIRKVDFYLESVKKPYHHKSQNPLQYTPSKVTLTEGMKRPTSILFWKQGGSIKVNPRVVHRSQATKNLP